MSRAHPDFAFTPALPALQGRMGSRTSRTRLDPAEDRRGAPTDRETKPSREHDVVHQATASEAGWRHAQLKSGQASFLWGLDAKTRAYANCDSDLQCISVGELDGDDRVAHVRMNDATQRRLKTLGRVRPANEADDLAPASGLQLPQHRAQAGRAIVITVEAYERNCTQHIMPRFSEAEIQRAMQPLRLETKQARCEQARLRDASPQRP
ncbi:pyridoxamine 5-phosphate oxidase [Mitsuaria sp. WAJ17]|uniref:pyridoxamine 5-phosphate oxidase n=1 Tax=Mitsuaria sp. WAJ17 TaxID=2761452 RepID=UPI0016039963|nr:pyridoxamine 5-phosphate oxidase [Mitsuaria sp. WAJ17]MBB2484193.1 pyridoxamine 5-phosphate oxidase [Mitsuaria sp. WAJ17]